MDSTSSQSPRRHQADLDLVERILAGDRAAFDTFGERYFSALYRFSAARLRGDGELARDIVQTAIAKALDKLDTYRGNASLMTWLCSCCSNEVLMYLRKRRSAPVELELEERIDVAATPGAFSASLEADPESAALEREAALQVHMALDELPSHYARVLEWKYVERLPVREIGSRLGVRPKAAESLLTRARKAFRVAYGSLRATPDAFAPGSGLDV